MTPQADSNTLDLFRERLASPFISTFFGVMHMELEIDLLVLI